MDEVRLKPGVVLIKQYLPIHDVTDKLGSSLIKLFRFIHSAISYDFSILFGTREKTVLETMKKNSGSLHDMRLFGNSSIM